MGHHFEDVRWPPQPQKVVRVFKCGQHDSDLCLTVSPCTTRACEAIKAATRLESCRNGQWPLRWNSKKVAKPVTACVEQTELFFVVGPVISNCSTFSNSFLRKAETRHLPVVWKLSIPLHEQQVVLGEQQVNRCLALDSLGLWVWSLRFGKTHVHRYDGLQVGCIHWQTRPSIWSLKHPKTHIDPPFQLFFPWHCQFETRVCINITSASSFLGRLAQAANGRDSLLMDETTTWHSMAQQDTQFFLGGLTQLFHQIFEQRWLSMLGAMDQTAWPMNDDCLSLT